MEDGAEGTPGDAHLILPEDDDLLQMNAALVLLGYSHAPQISALLKLLVLTLAIPSAGSVPYNSRLHSVACMRLLQGTSSTAGVAKVHSSSVAGRQSVHQVHVADAAPAPKQPATDTAAAGSSQHSPFLQPDRCTQVGHTDIDLSVPAFRMRLGFTL